MHNIALLLTLRSLAVVSSSTFSGTSTRWYNSSDMSSFDMSLVRFSRCYSIKKERKRKRRNHREGGWSELKAIYFIGLLHHRRETEVKDILVCFSEHIFSSLTFSVSAGSKRRTISRHDLITAVDDGEDILDGNNYDYLHYYFTLLQPDPAMLPMQQLTALAQFLSGKKSRGSTCIMPCIKSRRPQRSTILPETSLPSHRPFNHGRSNRQQCSSRPR